MNIIDITEFSAPELDVYARLTEAQLLNHHMIKEGVFIAESAKVISRALDGGYEPISVLAEKGKLYGENLEVIERCGDIPVFTADFNVISKLTGYMLTRGTLCAMKRKELPNPHELLEKYNRVAVLEDVMNPTNLGAIFRSAAALGIDAVMLTPGCSNPLYRRSARVSMGTVFQVPWTYLSKHWTEDLKSAEFKTVAMALTDNSLCIDDPILKNEKRLAIVLGTEGDGLKETTVALCDYTVKIPMAHGVDSLNVAAAGAVAFWELRKR